MRNQKCSPPTMRVYPRIRSSAWGDWRGNDAAEMEGFPAGYPLEANMQYEAMDANMPCEAKESNVPGDCAQVPIKKPKQADSQSDAGSEQRDTEDFVLV